MDEKLFNHIARNGSVLVEYPCTDCTDGYQPVSGTCIECGKVYRTEEDFKLLQDSKELLPCCGSNFSKYYESQPPCAECEGTRVIQARISMKDLAGIVTQHFIVGRI